MCLKLSFVSVPEVKAKNVPSLVCAGVLPSKLDEQHCYFNSSAQ